MKTLATSAAVLLLSLAPRAEGQVSAGEAGDARAAEASADSDAGLNASMGPATEPLPPAPKGEHPYKTTVVGDRPDPSLIGSSATTVTRSEIEDLPGGDTQPITDIVRMQPGVQGDAFGSNLHIRASDGALQYVIDGVPLVSPAVGTIGQLLNTIPTRLIQNFQFFSGGFPVDYSYSLGGVVDIRTQRPTRDPTAEIQLTHGSWDHTDVQANYSQQMGKLGILASGEFVTTARGLDTPDAISILHDDRIGGNGFLKLNYELDGRNRLELIAILQEDRFQIPIDATMLPLSDAPPGAIRGNDVYGNPPPQFVPYGANPTDLERTLFVAASYLHTGEVSSQLSVYAREIYENFNCDPAGSLGASADPKSFCSDYTRDAYQFGVLGRMTWQWLAGNSWKAGFQLDEAPSKLDLSVFTRNDALAQGGPDSSLTIATGDTIHTLTGGAYLEDRIEFGDFTLLPGFRFDVQNTTFDSASLSPLFLSGPSGRLGISYAPAEWVVLHAFAGYLWEAPTAFDAPAIAPAFNPMLAGQNNLVNLKPATTWSGEVGTTFHPTHRLTLALDGWGRLMHNWLDHTNVGNSALWTAFNWDQGRAAGGDVYGSGELFRFWNGRFVLDAFGNLSAEYADQLNIDTETYLFPPEVLAASHTLTIQDHVQFWSANVGLMLHDADRMNNVSVRVNYGSGFHTGVSTNEQVPEHTTVDLTASHTFDFPGKPQIAVDVFNVFNDIYAYRLGTAYFGNSQYAALLHVDVRLALHFG